MSYSGMQGNLGGGFHEFSIGGVKFRMRLLDQNFLAEIEKFLYDRAVQVVMMRPDLADPASRGAALAELAAGYARFDFRWGNRVPNELIKNPSGMAMIFSMLSDSPDNKDPNKPQRIPMSVFEKMFRNPANNDDVKFVSNLVFTESEPKKDLGDPVPQMPTIPGEGS